MGSVFRWSFLISMVLSNACLAHEWEVGAAGGFGWYDFATIRNDTASAQAGLKAGFAIGATP
jgi:hypothetical protein